MFSTFDLRLLLYVIRLAGWLKHCNLSQCADAICRPAPQAEGRKAPLHDLPEVLL